ncbi:MAG: hypothetical protein LBG21_04125 [Campylobacteraceae bacterium]|jgi:hypothetical protein|nr:hypothetical protein [Campylobacteraceae bacterium]
MKNDEFVLYYKVLDYLFPDWEKREDNYFLHQLAAYLHDVYKINKLERTIAKNMRESQIGQYIEIFKKILITPIENIDWYFEHRLSEDREMANQARYIGIKYDKKIKQKNQNCRQANLFERKYEWK